MSHPLPFHPAVARWFRQTFAAPTPAQAEAWPAILAGSHTRIAAPTGSGKTLAAFLAAIDSLVRQGLDGGLLDATQVVYISPLKALSNDIDRNLAAPLAGISAELRKQGLPEVEVRTWVRTGDTPTVQRTQMLRRPPHIVVTTPESFYLLLGSDSGRAMLKTTRTVIVDEIHALAPSKRGSHLALSLERLAALCPQPVVRIGLSATQKPIEDVARLLVGEGGSAGRSLSPPSAGPRREEPCHNGPEGDGERDGVRGGKGLQPVNGDPAPRSGPALARGPLAEGFSLGAAPHTNPLPASGERGSGR